MRKYSDIEHIKQIEQIVENLPLVAISTFSETSIFGAESVPSCYAKRFAIKLPSKRVPYITFWYHQSRNLASVGGIGLNMFYIFRYCPAIEDLYKKLPSPESEPNRDIISTWQL